MQQRRRFQQQIQFAKSAAGWLGTGDVLDARQQMRQGISAGVCGRAINNFVRVVEAEGDGVAVLQFAAFGFLAVDEQAAALAAILDVVLAGFGDDGGAVARYAAIGELK